MAQAGVGKDDIQASTGHVVGLHDVTFSVESGEIFVIMGLSGSGKSTAIRTVNRLYDVTSGTVTVDGTDVAQLNKKELEHFRRQKMGMVFQHFALFPHRTVVDNVAYGLKVKGMSAGERWQRAIEALELVGLERYYMSFPRQLSGGMQQRVGLARALAADLDILLMDEAFSALDPLIRRQMQDELLAMQGHLLHKTILFITHDLNEALRVGDRVCIMKDGAVVQIGTPEEILRNPETAYVAEFVKDVDQGRVLRVQSVMSKSLPITLCTTLSAALVTLGSRDAAFCVDADGKPCGVITRELLVEPEQARVETVMRTDFKITTPTALLVDAYDMCAQGELVAVINERGVLEGQLHAFDLLAELGAIETQAERVKAAELVGEAACAAHH
ncbi:MAG: betaine/proline/choline family ABC transporter ATP-binding protein [Acidimicrobiia bacterium]|nr:betaine/proline/choline family ABC transporter ATP-binding protein [Acidimicrobiia bacterium]MYC58276.1 betaine/proline/choline family ABC transporter ATP-binding protein [Acidimicrobiia bacterium]MYI30966.1 betaine/proline/choline family ABC transporter ATP-binding protein [Acidimicrobiia bacterium]